VSGEKGTLPSQLAERGSCHRRKKNRSQIKEGKIMKKILFALIFSWGLVAITVLAQEQKGMPMGGGGMMEMKDHMGEMQKSMGGMMKGEEMKGMEQMMGCSNMTPEEMKNMSKMMEDMSSMMKHMSECMKGGMGKTK